MRLLEWFYSIRCCCPVCDPFQPETTQKRPPLIRKRGMGNGYIGRNEKIEVGRTDNLIERRRKKIFGWFHQISWRRRRGGNYVGGGGIRRNFHLLLAVDPLRPHSEMEGRRMREENMFFFSPPLLASYSIFSHCSTTFATKKEKKYCDIGFLKKKLFAIRKPKAPKVKNIPILLKIITKSCWICLRGKTVFFFFFSFLLMTWSFPLLMVSPDSPRNIERPKDGRWVAQTPSRMGRYKACSIHIRVRERTHLGYRDTFAHGLLIHLTGNKYYPKGNFLFPTFFSRFWAPKKSNLFL